MRVLKVASGHGTQNRCQSLDFTLSVEVAVKLSAPEGTFFVCPPIHLRIMRYSPVPMLARKTPNPMFTKRHRKKKIPMATKLAAKTCLYMAVILTTI